jgi:beta-1,4-mannosyl-glycoprotein beta-1,4-N-acetylglucosaminyltransferase
MKIIDSFIFYNELDLLNYRLNILDDYVDYFILVESRQSFAGNEKNLIFEENKNLFLNFSKKIIHVIVDLPFKKNDIENNRNLAWRNEEFQRNSIKLGIEKLSLSNEDIIITSDVDEIINPEILNKLKNGNLDYDKNNLNRIGCDMYYFNLNCLIHRNQWCGIKLLNFNTYKTKGYTFEQMRTLEWHTNVNKIDNGGWHLSYFSDISGIKNKIQNFSHQEFNYNGSKYLDEDFIKDCYQNCKNLFDNQSLSFIEIKDNENLPPRYDEFLKKYFK